MTDQNEDNLKNNESVNSNYPRMDLKPLGGGIKSSNKISRSSSLSNNDTVQEEDLAEVGGSDGVSSSMTKSKFKHVNIMTDSDEFNLHKVSEQVGIQQSASQMLRVRSTSNDQQQYDEYISEIQEDKIEEEQEQNTNKMTTSKLGISTHSIEESILLDKGEFDCNTPTRYKNPSILKKVSSNIGYSQFNNKEEIITEDPEKETDGTCNMRVSSHKEIKLKVDEIDYDKTKQFTPRLNYMDVTIIEEVKEEEMLDNNRQLQSAKNEREQEKEYIKKIVKGDKIHQGEKMIHMSEASGLTLNMATNKINENQQDEDVGDNDNNEDKIDYQKQRRISMNLVEKEFDEEEEVEQDNN